MTETEKDLKNEIDRLLYRLEIVEGTSHVWVDKAHRAEDIISDLLMHVQISRESAPAIEAAEAFLKEVP